MPRKPRSESRPSRPSRRDQRIEILCFADEKDAIRRRAGNVPLGRWGRIKLLGRHTSAADELIPVSRVIGFFETVERLALEGDLAQLIESARTVQRHLRSGEA